VTQRSSASAALSVEPGATSRKLAHLRTRMTIIYGLAAIIGLTTLALIATIADTRVRGQRFDEEVKGLSSRASLLPMAMRGRTSVDGLLDDTILDQVTAVMVVSAGPPRTVVYQNHAIDGGVDLAAEVTDGHLEDPDRGSRVRTLRVDGVSVRAFARPYYYDDRTDQIAGAVVIAKARPSESDHRMLVASVWATAGVLAIGATTAGWVFAGRQVREAGAFLDRQEAFLALAAHELRTPIGRSRAVAESAQLLLSEAAADPVVGAANQQAEAELDRLVSINRDMSSTIDDLLLVGRIDARQEVATRFQPERLDELVLPLDDDAQGVSVQTDGPTWVSGDRVLLRQLVLNLVGNAARHSVIDVEERPTIDVTVGRSRDGRQVVLTVGDRGPGFPPELDGHACDRFVTGAGGTGIGLWIVSWIVDLHGGTLDIGERPGGGALVTVRFPVAEQVLQK
jgi:two-component system OmpR family sensor kinase